MQMHTYQPTYLHALSRRLFESAGATNEVGHIVANILVGANLTGHDSHGVLRVPTYMTRISDGIMNAGAEPTTVRESVTTLVLDGHQGPGHLTAYRAINKAIEKARTSEICSVSFTRIEHIGRLGHYVEIAAREGFVGIAMVGRGAPNALKVLPFGGKKGSLGTNPIAIGIPTGDEIPFLLDIATSVVAEGKLQVARSKNVHVPENYIVDKNNVPTTDPQEFYDGGYLRTFGGHKGYAFSLAACLMGQLGGNYGEGCPLGYAFMQVINISAFTDLTGYQNGMRDFLNEIKKTEPADGVEEVQVPGEFEHHTRTHRLQHGIEIPDTINQQLLEWADHFKVPTDDSIITPEDKAYYTPVS